MRSVRALASTALVGLTATALTACSLVGGGDDDERAADGSTPPGGSEVVLVTHESFTLPEEVLAAFEEESGYRLKVRSAGDAGSLTNRLVLTKSSPLGDVVFGVDNTFASRALEEGVIADTDVERPAGAATYDLEAGEGSDDLVPVDTGNVCVNIDDTWFAREGLEPPTTLDDLTDPAYRDLLVVPGATTSSPGLAFLLATIAEEGDGWADYWERLVGNGAKLVDGWSDAYQVDFTQGGGKGDRPIVVSYDSSPAFTLDGEGGTTTSALLDTCFRQVEYAGLLEGAENPEGGEALLEFLLGPEVQAALPESMYVFPVRDDVELPADWARFAEQPTEAYAVDPAEIAANRDTWLREWSDVTTR
ncbi:thiamine ABC transporter substrate binding subunit [Nocardioides marmotae]|uniref:thiamine ABC transporter substrate-binding protein n=1 Tax=Nocardioides marmotae TaxID=2663857 RepID=UPI0012B59B4A|nr:thiamine ABC transporter substrate-binding protein [Nocardioides marmotae]MBC9732901.1 thiamine ABC transporter substrate-binding protein [Nocardioides marmotae]MTB84015.1 thiamine ABC transporter substrate-binding protein [Nocardioides marmotae]